MLFQVRCFACLLPLLGLLSCSAARVQLAQPSKSVWAVDFVRTRPGQSARYLVSVHQNWARARNYAQRAGYILSYKAYLTRADSAGDFDVLLLTEYADSASYARREENFDKIFKQYLPVRPNARDTRDIRFDKLLREVPFDRRPPTGR
jgi:hypothetical protein